MTTFLDQFGAVTERLYTNDPLYWLLGLGINEAEFLAAMRVICKREDAPLASICAAFQCGAEWGRRFAPEHAGSRP